MGINGVIHGAVVWEIDLFRHTHYVKNVYRCQEKLKQQNALIILFRGREMQHYSGNGIILEVYAIVATPRRQTLKESIASKESKVQGGI
jgi:hypothetical protein